MPIEDLVQCEHLKWERHYRCLMHVHIFLKA